MQPLTDNVSNSERHMSANHDHDDILRRRKRNRRLQRPINATQGPNFEEADRSYLTRKVDPILSQAIAFLLVEQPSQGNILPCLLEFLKQCVPGGKQSCPNSVPGLRRKQKQKSKERLYFAKSIAPCLSLLMNATAVSKPDDVHGFLLSKVQCLVVEEKGRSSDSGFVDLPQLKLKKAKRLSILVVGMDGSGKSTMISTLKGNVNPRCNPTLGFCPVLMKLGTSTVQLYEIGGGQRIRGIWENYFHDVHGVIYVLDASCDDDRFEESIRIAKKTVGHKYIQGKPLLVICNKHDDPSARSAESIQNELNIAATSGGSDRIIATSLDPRKSRFGGAPDPAIESSLEWLFNAVFASFDEISERVASDAAIEKRKLQEQQIIKERRVMKKMICKAFQLEGEEKGDTFDMKEGEDFLAAEIGLEGRAALPPEAAAVASLVGYQKLAMMMVGSLVAPISAKKKKWTWMEVKDYIQGIRSEISGIAAVNQQHDDAICVS